MVSAKALVVQGVPMAVAHRSSTYANWRKAHTEEGVLTIANMMRDESNNARVRRSRLGQTAQG